MKTHKKAIRDLGFTIHEVSELEKELIKNIESSGLDDDNTKRLCRIVSNKLGFVRSAIHGQNWLETNGFAEIIRG